MRVKLINKSGGEACQAAPAAPVPRCSMACHSSRYINVLFATIPYGCFSVSNRIAASTMRHSPAPPPSLLLLLLASALGACLADISFPSYISSSMLIQRNAPFSLSGTDLPHSQITATFAGLKYTAPSPHSRSHFICDVWFCLTPPEGTPPLPMHRGHLHSRFRRSLPQPPP